MKQRLGLQRVLSYDSCVCVQFKRKQQLAEKLKEQQRQLAEKQKEREAQLKSLKSEVPERHYNTLQRTPT